MKLSEAIETKSEFAIYCETVDALQNVADAMKDMGFRTPTFLPASYASFPFMVVFPTIKEFTNQSYGFLVKNSIELIAIDGTYDLANTTTNLNSPAEHSSNVL